MDLISQIAAELRAEGKDQYNERWVRERRFNMQLPRLTGDEAQQRLKWIESLSDQALNKISAHVAVKAADRVIARTEDTLREKMPPLIPSHILDFHTVLGSDGRPGLDSMFDTSKWSRRR